MLRRNFFWSILALPFGLPKLEQPKATFRAGTPQDGPVVEGEVGDVFFYGGRAGKTAALWETCRIFAQAHPFRKQAIATPKGRYEITWIPN